MKPSVSILIPCYNAERWVAQAIESALNQTLPEKEVIVVDDGSTDGSLDVIKKFGNRIRWETGPNRGGNAARNQLLQLSRGEWLQYLDADDYLTPDKLSKQAEFLQEKPETDIVFSPMVLEHWSEAGSEFEATFVPEPHDPWILLARWFLPGTGSGLWRKQALHDVGGWNERQPCCQEHELYLRLLIAGKKFNFCPDGGYIYRQWGSHTVCKRDRRETNRRRLDIEQRIEDFLRSQKLLLPARLEAINQGRFETARTAWQYDSKFAREIVKSIRRSQPGFIPHGKVAPSRYRSAYGLLGFTAAEFLASTWRNLLGNRSSQENSALVPPRSERIPANVYHSTASKVPFISILIPCYNAEQWIHQAIESALAQIWPEKEVIVVDDGSTDDSLKIIKQFGDRIRWETGPNRGGNVARNRLLQLARGEWLQYLDADDYLLPEKLSTQAAILTTYPDTDIIFSGVTVEHWSESETRHEIQAVPYKTDQWVLLALWLLPQTGACLWRRQAILEVGGWKSDQPCCQEHELYLRLLMAGKRFRYCPGHEAVYRYWSENTVWRRNKPETHRRRLEIERRIEEHLRERNEITPERIWAINQARLETARKAWHYNRDFARQIIATIRKSQPRFTPGRDAAPLSYRTAFRLLGFQAAERLAACKRTLAGSVN